MKTIWILTRTEYCGQCTGFDSDNTLLGVFTEKPGIELIAPFLSRGLSSSIGQAVSEIQRLLDKGEVSLGDGSLEYRLALIPTNARIETL